MTNRGCIFSAAAALCLAGPGTALSSDAHKPDNHPSISSGAIFAGASGPTRLSSRPALRGYACLHRSQAYTGFAEPTFKFTLKRENVWIDRSFKDPIKGKYRWRKRKLVLFSKKGNKLHTFAHFRDSSGKYLREHPVPQDNNALICR